MKIARRGAAVFNNSFNRLQLVEVNVLSDQKMVEGRQLWVVDEQEAEKQGLLRLAEEKPGEHWDYVGTLFADLGGITRGRIDWASDFERKEVVV